MSMKSMPRRTNEAGTGMGAFLQKSAWLVVALLFLLMPANASTCTLDECSPHSRPMAECAGMGNQDCPAFLRVEHGLSCCRADQIPSKSTNQDLSWQRFGHDSLAAAPHTTTLRVFPSHASLPTCPRNSPPDLHSLFCTLLI
jgi:hypothetical protein